MVTNLKSRYKICFQTRNKVWIYKNSRLRYFYKIRSKIVLLQGRVAKKFITTQNNMKWRVIRRKMVPYTKTKNRYKFQYKNLFFTKQQLKNFYGGLHEYQIRNIFKKTWNKELFYRRNIFIGGLEQRLNMFLFRMRLLPTIFACTQFIMHKGILVNNQCISLPSFRVKLGAIVSIPKNHWYMFYKFLFERLRSRFNGELILNWRIEYKLKKIQHFHLKRKDFHIQNLKLFNKFFFYKKKSLHINEMLTTLLVDNQNLYITKKFFLGKKKEIQKNIKILLYLKILFNKTLIVNLKKIKKNWWKIVKRASNVYAKNVRYIFFKLFFIKKFLIKFIKFIIFFLQNGFYSVYFSNYYLKNLSVKMGDLRNIFKDKYIILEHLKMESFWSLNYKKIRYLNFETKQYTKWVIYMIKKFKYRKRKLKVFKNWCSIPHLYIPKYLEIDFKTFRAVFVYYPESHEVVLGFPCNFRHIIAFYKERSL